MAGLPKGQREQALLLVCILAIASMGLYWYFVYSPRSQELNKTQTQVDALLRQNQRAKAELAKGDLSELQRELAQYQQNLALVRTLVPAGNEVPALLEQVSTAARRVGLDLASVDPQPVQTGSDYDTYRYGMAVVGGYHDLAKFFANVGSLTRIVLPVNVTLQLSTNANARQENAKAGAAVIEAHFQLQTFVTHGSPATGDDAPPTATGAKS